MNPYGIGNKKYWTRERILDAITRWTEERGKAPGSREWRTPPAGFPSNWTVSREFGTFEAARRAAGVVFLRSTQEDVTREEILAAIYRWRFTHGQLPKEADWPWPRDGWPGQSAVRRLFGSWNAAILAAGYAPKSRKLGSDHVYRARIAAITKRAAA